MMKSRILAIIMLAICGAPTPAFAQAHVLEGNTLPMDYDGGGGRHYRMYGYYGDYDPAMPSGTKGRPRQVSRSKHHTASRHAGSRS
jgi:hypothetical protein